MSSDSASSASSSPSSARLNVGAPCCEGLTTWAAGADNVAGGGALPGCNCCDSMAYSASMSEASAPVAFAAAAPPAPPWEAGVAALALGTTDEAAATWDPAFLAGGAKPSEVEATGAAAAAAADAAGTGAAAVTACAAAACGAAGTVEAAWAAEVVLGGDTPASFNNESKKASLSSSKSLGSPAPGITCGGHGWAQVRSWGGGED
mmetsp:Transcript_59458/g.168551  ORF Transcript_59458/g.168551 Transcript_59458/m.168551 type:complete len:205 (+) Transcript_59458:1312-1926(+)